ncbi:MAG: sigma-54 dependent transcriptional regulator [Myxococcales bacterium]|jgi:sigma-54-specific transcriptional regulator
MTLLTLPGASALALSVRAKALVFEDPKSIALLGRVHAVAPRSGSVLVTGETGTGRELVARHLHELSPRAGRPFLAVNCSGFTQAAAESELFGHEKGAFDGATSAKAGWLEAAHGGTLFLDEIGDLSPKLQSKLLRVLELGEVVRMGTDRPTLVDVRVVAATNVDLEQAVAARHFRADLLHRLAAERLELAPLRERPGDILPLARHFLGFYAKGLELGPKELSAEAGERLLAHSWPGNIRELENAMHHALLLSHGPQITRADLRLSSHDRATLERASSNSAQRPSFDDGKRSPLVGALEELFEQRPPNLFEHIEELVLRTAYRHCAHNQLQTARLLGISRNVVRARLIRFGEITGSVRGTPRERADHAREATE